MSKNKPYPKWVYHKTLPAKIISSDELEKYLEEGWKKSPAEFCHTPDFGVDPKDKAAVQQLGEAVTGVADFLDAELNLDKMTSNELDEVSEKHLGETFKGSKVAKIIKMKEAMKKEEALSKKEVN